MTGRICAATVALADGDLRRIGRYHGSVHTDPLSPRRCSRYLAVRWLIGLLGAGVMALLGLSVVVAISMISAWLFDTGWALISNDNGVDGLLLATVALPGALIIFVAIMGVPAVGSLDRWWAARQLGRDSQRALSLRVAELAGTREQVLDAVDDERRRIERDLHDGLQQRLIALGLLISRSGRSKSASGRDELLHQAQSTLQDAITELREVSTRVYPAVLDSDGLGAALESLAERAGIPVRVHFGLPGRLRQSVETAVYFAVSEAVTNAIKHGRADAVEITVAEQRHARVLACVRDTGRGGADPAGRGLAGLARRIAAVDGTLTVDSPDGGPTTVSVSIPCG